LHFNFEAVCIFPLRKSREKNAGEYLEVVRVFER